MIVKNIFKYEISDYVYKDHWYICTFREIECIKTKDISYIFEKYSFSKKNIEIIYNIDVCDIVYLKTHDIEIYFNNKLIHNENGAALIYGSKKYYYLFDKIYYNVKDYNKKLRKIKLNKLLCFV